SRPLLSFPTRRSSDLLQFVLLEVHAQHITQGSDGQFNDFLPVALGVILVLQFLLQMVESLLLLGTGRSRLVSDVVSGGIALVELGSFFGIQRDQGRGNSEWAHVCLGTVMVSLFSE